MHNIMGNSAQGVGYGCQMADLVATWRHAWSATQGTTDPLAPFGVVTLAPGGDEGGKVGEIVFGGGSEGGRE